MLFTEVTEGKRSFTSVSQSLKVLFEQRRLWAWALGALMAGAYYTLTAVLSQSLSDWRKGPRLTGRKSPWMCQWLKCDLTAVVIALNLKLIMWIYHSSVIMIKSCLLVLWPRCLFLLEMQQRLQQIWARGPDVAASTYVWLASFLFYGSSCSFLPPASVISLSGWLLFPSKRADTSHRQRCANNAECCSQHDPRALLLLTLTSPGEAAITQSALALQKKNKKTPLIAAGTKRLTFFLTTAVKLAVNTETQAWRISVI